MCRALIHRNGMGARKKRNGRHSIARAVRRGLDQAPWQGYKALPPVERNESCMAKVLPPPVLIVRPQRAQRRWRRTLALGLAWLASLAAVAFLQQRFADLGEHPALAQA